MRFGPEHGHEWVAFERTTELNVGRFDDGRLNDAATFDEAAMSDSKTPKGPLFLALGEAVVKMWSNLSHDIQQRLFEQVVASHGEDVRQQLAVFLHDHHTRTLDAVKAKAMPEPDSLGG